MPGEPKRVQPSRNTDLTRGTGSRSDLRFKRTGLVPHRGSKRSRLPRGMAEFWLSAGRVGAVAKMQKRYAPRQGNVQTIVEFFECSAAPRHAVDELRGEGAKRSSSNSSTWPSDGSPPCSRIDQRTAARSRSSESMVSRAGS